MGRLQDFILAGTAAGMPMSETVTAMLSGATEHSSSLCDILADCQDPELLTQAAAAALALLNDFQSVAKALVDLGIHPLSLFFTEECSEFHAWKRVSPRWKNWLCENGREPRFYRLHGSICYIEHFNPSSFLRAIESRLDIVFGRRTKAVVIRASCLTGLISSIHPFGTKLTIRDCTGDMRLPPHISGDFRLLFNEATFHFPTRMAVHKRMWIRECSGIHALPEELCVEELHIERCSKLQQLPRRFRGTTHIDLVCIPADSFPAGVEGLQYLRLVNAPNLKTLPLPSSKDLDMELFCLPGLQEIDAPSGSSFRNLFVSCCDRLKRLPEGLNEIGGDLILSRLGQLEAIPPRLRIEGDLRIISCHRLRSLPEDLTVGGSVEIRDCPGLRRVPEQIRASLV